MDGNQEAVVVAIRGNHLDCLKYLHEQGCEYTMGACNAAASEGHLDCLKYLYEQGYKGDQIALN